ncbi:cytochrome P450 [Tricladium varicosporioides]|nr:cytochrome P450 [Hymenoscyphus varicosporioides]
MLQYFGQTALATPLIFIPLAFVANLFYNVYFHPLREYPGPYLWRATRWAWAYHAFRGNISYRVAELHAKYGDVVRIAPDELSYMNAQAWTDIYGHRTAIGQGNLPKESRTRPREVNGVSSIITANEEDHRRMRRLQSHMFSEKALASQEPLIVNYVDKLISRLHEQARNPDKSIVDIVKWYNYTTFDLLGELAFGDSFGCLDSDVLHPWIANIFLSVKDDAFIRVSKHFPWPLNKIVYAIRPKELGNAREEEFTFASVKAKERMSQGVVTDRTDFMNYILKYNDEKGMTPDEIESNSSLLILAGSETTATFLSGISYNLLRNPEVLKKLTTLVRTKFSKDSDINMLAVQKLDYFTACLEEGLRMHPPIPSGLPRSTTTGGNIICNKYVPPETTVSVHQLTTYNSPKNFTDPGTFIPERWVKDVPERYVNDNRKSVQPFSTGPRNCIGRNLAYAEMRLILAKMFWNFDFELQPDSQNWSKQKVYGFFWEKTPLNVKLIPRKC